MHNEKRVIHNIVDYSPLYYKYMFQMKAGRMRKLNVEVDTPNGKEELDISIIYYTIKEIEGFRRKLEKMGYEVITSVCFDMPSKRKEKALETTGQAYKGGRKNKLGEDDFKKIDIAKELLEKAGHNVYMEEGYEADDLIEHLTKQYKDEFYGTIIYTNDKDMLTNIDDFVTVRRYKTNNGWTTVNKENYEQYVSKEMKCRVPYNALGLFLATVGDKSDNIPGIFRFGPKAFDTLIDTLDEKYDINWEECGDYDKLKEVFSLCQEVLTPEQFEQARDSFNLVKPIKLDIEVPKPKSKSTKEKRESSYMKYNMKSIIE